MDAFKRHDPMETGVGMIDRSDRVRIEVSGPDRAKFLHNLTTNEVKRLAAGRGCEAFVTSLQGKTIGYVIILAAEDRIVVRSDPGGMELALAHFGKYGMFDDVTIADRTEQTFELHLTGARDGFARSWEGEPPGEPGRIPARTEPRPPGITQGHLADQWVRKAGGRVPDGPGYAHVLGELGGRPVRIVRESPAGMPGLSVIGEKEDLARVTAALATAAGVGHITELGPTEFEALRIEAGTPVFGKDVTEKNLPQELARDARAISFVKGCYLGQETVARIDALGHVNQVLKGLSFERGSECPAPGSALEADGKRVGAITSAVASPWRGHPVALGMIRTSHANAGTPLMVATAGAAAPDVATVCDLPFPPRT